MSAVDSVPSPLLLQGSQSWAFGLYQPGVCDTTMWFMLHLLNAFPMSPCMRNLSSRGGKAAKAEADGRVADRAVTAAEEGLGEGLSERHCSEGASKEGRDQGEGRF